MLARPSVALALTLSLVGCAPEATLPRPTLLPPVYVDFRADDPAAHLERLERRANDARWESVCASPCRRTVRPDVEYRVAGSELTSSAPFRLYGPTSIVARTGSARGRAFGVAGVAVGIPLMIVGSVLTLVGSLSGLGGHGGSDDGFYSGLAVLGGGTALVVSGSVVMSRSRTVVDLEERGPVAKLTLQF